MAITAAHVVVATGVAAVVAVAVCECWTQIVVPGLVTVSLCVHTCVCAVRMNDGKMAHNMLIKSIFLSDRHKKGVKLLFPLFQPEYIEDVAYNNDAYESIRMATSQPITAQIPIYFYICGTIGNVIIRFNWKI